MRRWWSTHCRQNDGCVMRARRQPTWFGALGGAALVAMLLTGVQPPGASGSAPARDAKAWRWLDRTEPLEQRVSQLFGTAHPGREGDAAVRRGPAGVQRGRRLRARHQATGCAAADPVRRAGRAPRLGPGHHRSPRDRDAGHGGAGRLLRPGRWPPTTAGCWARRRGRAASTCCTAPAINIDRVPVGGRDFEYFSEDPYLTGQLAAPVVAGVQSQRVAAQVKHFALNNQENARRHRELEREATGDA